MKGAYYNEWEPYAAQWLRNLIAARLIPAGDVDERSICDVHPDDLRGYGQCHFFAGLGGWAYAARLAGWPDDRPIRARRPAVIMGEQVAAAVGKDWLDGVCADLEGIGYACGAAVVPACAVNAPHRRDRLWFVAQPDGQHDQRGSGEKSHVCSTEVAEGADYDNRGSGQNCDSMADAAASREGRRGICRSGKSTYPADKRASSESARSCHSNVAERGGAWSGAAWLTGADRKARRVEPGIRLLAHGIPARVGKLRTLGNAIVPQVAAEVIGAFLDAEAAQCAP